MKVANFRGSTVNIRGLRMHTSSTDSKTHGDQSSADFPTSHEMPERRQHHWSVLAVLPGHAQSYIGEFGRHLPNDAMFCQNGSNNGLSCHALAPNNHRGSQPKSDI